jgi:F-type H+-transporting ATPase subunit b
MKLSVSLRGAKTKTLALIAAAVLALSLSTFAQTPAPPSSSELPANPSAENTSGNAANTTSEPKSSEDETAQFKHSASVQLLARLTGLSIDGAYWLAVLLNFAIVAGLIAWAAKKNLPAMFRNRTASIQKSLEEARAASEDAKQRLAQIESRLSHLDDEVNQIRAASEKEAAAEEERIKAAAAEEAKRISESAGQEIAAATKAARRELTAYAADLAVSLATKQIRIDAATDQGLVRRFAQQIAFDSNSGAGKSSDGKPGDGKPGKKA